MGTAVVAALGQWLKHGAKGQRIRQGDGTTWRTFSMIFGRDGREGG